MGKRRKRLTNKKYASKYATIRANIAKMKGLSPVEEQMQEASPVLPDPPLESIVEPTLEPVPVATPEPVSEPVEVQPPQPEPKPEPVVASEPKKVVKKPAVKKPARKKTPAKPKTQPRVRKTSKKEI
tara:strand:- start:424 stop:804 length:381 start_codon:yes stop_codon:yes gene_type:complete